MMPGIRQSLTRVLFLVLLSIDLLLARALAFVLLVGAADR